MSDNDRQTVSPAGDGKYLLLVGGILLVIVLTLAVLWQLERHRRISAQEKFTNCAEELNKANLYSEMLSRANKAIESVGVDRENLTSRQVDLDGRPRKLFRISAAAGEKMGFLPGDLVEIDNPPPDSAPEEH